MNCGGGATTNCGAICGCIIIGPVCICGGGIIVGLTAMPALPGICGTIGGYYPADKGTISSMCSSGLCMSSLVQSGFSYMHWSGHSASTTFLTGQPFKSVISGQNSAQTAPSHSSLASSRKSKSFYAMTCLFIFSCGTKPATPVSNRSANI